MDRSFTWRRLRRQLVIGIVVVALAIGVFKVPLASILFVGLALLCPLMMLGMHGGGHDHAGHGVEGNGRGSDRLGGSDRTGSDADPREEVRP